MPRKVFTFYGVQLIRKPALSSEDFCKGCYFHREGKNVFNTRHLCVERHTNKMPNYPCIIKGKDVIFVRKDKHGKR